MTAEQMLGRAGPEAIARQRITPGDKLELLMRNGKSQSAAIRDALVDASKLRLYEQAAEDAARIASDPDDLRETAAIRAFFSAVDAEG